ADSFRSERNPCMVFICRELVIQQIRPYQVTAVAGGLRQLVGVRIPLRVVIVIIRVSYGVKIRNGASERGPEGEIFQYIRFSKYIAGDIPLIVPVIVRAALDRDGIATVPEIRAT